MGPVQSFIYDPAREKSTPLTVNDLTIMQPGTKILAADKDGFYKIVIFQRLEEKKGRKWVAFQNTDDNAEFLKPANCFRQLSRKK